MPNQNRPVFPNHRHQSSNRYWRYPSHWVLVPFPRTYFEVEDIRPSEDEFSGFTVEIFESTTSGLTIPKELNRKILQYLLGKDLLRFAMASKKAEMIVEYCNALMYDAIHKRIKDLVEELRSSRGWKEGQPNEQKFKVDNCVQVGGVENGYVVRVTPKIVFYVTEPDIFKSQPHVRRIGNNNGVKPMRPYYAAVPVEFVKNWRTWASLTEKFPYRD
jgi:hypothetical protein